MQTSCTKTESSELGRWWGTRRCRTAYLRGESGMTHQCSPVLQTHSDCYAPQKNPFKKNTRVDKRYLQICGVVQDLLCNAGDHWAVAGEQECGCCPNCLSCSVDARDSEATFYQADGRTPSSVRCFGRILNRWGAADPPRCRASFFRLEDRRGEHNLARSRNSVLAFVNAAADCDDVIRRARVSINRRVRLPERTLMGVGADSRLLRGFRPVVVAAAVGPHKQQKQFVGGASIVCMVDGIACCWCRPSAVAGVDDGRVRDWRWSGVAVGSGGGGAIHKGCHLAHDAGL